MYHFIINPSSRSGKGLKIWKQQLEPYLQANGIESTVHLSKEPGDIAPLMKHLSKTCGVQDRIVLLGGDGTLNEALQGVTPYSNVPIGYIPTGSSNDFARDMKIPTDSVKALRIILDAREAKPLDMGVLTYPDGQTTYFAGSSGIGFDAAVCEAASSTGQKGLFNRLGLGKLTYTAIALKQLARSPRVAGEITLDDGDPIRVDNMIFTCVMVHRFEGGGFMFCPDADATDGVLNLCSAGNVPKSVIPLAMLAAFQGKHFKYEGVTPYTAKKVVIRTEEPLWVHTDGEVIRRSNGITVTCLQKALLMYLPG
ncbi:MAG: diacylglycerol/lipid kinase family protein [Acetatifactor sp.]